MAKATKNFLLLIGDDGALLLPPERAEHTGPLFAPTNDPSARQPLLDAIAASPQTPVCFLNDANTVNYRIDQIPSLSHRDRRKLIKRHLKEIEPEAPYHDYLELNSNEALLIVVSETGALAQWKNALSELQNPNETLLLLPLESEDLAATLDPDSEDGWTMLLTFNATGGMRQIVTYNGQFVFSRKTPLIPQSSSQGFISAAIAMEIKATRDYLAREGLDKDMPLSLVAIVPPSFVETMRVTPLDVGHRTIFSPYEAARACRFDVLPQPEETMSDIIHALWARQKDTLRLPLFRDDLREHLAQMRIRSFGYMLVILAALCTGMILGFFALSSIGRHHKIYELKNDVQLIQESMQNQRESRSSSAQQLDRLNMAIDRQILFAPRPQPALELLKRIGAFLPPDRRISRFVWQNGVLTLTLRAILAENEPTTTEKTHALLVQAQNDLQKYLQEYTVSLQPQGQAATTDHLAEATFLITKKETP
ncbi:MAG: hypothetical protein EOM37_06805 [Proteobacteria bacterium]|jgi:hypothetical protein|nr:hypothetical protein [Alphaproteobacteria bacterium]NCC03737.1 hypothetical protein [Pseudomonadota bacterium]